MVPIISAAMALGLPLFALYREGKKPLRRPYRFSLFSFLFCAAAELGELLVIKRRVLAHDFGGIEDTIDAVIIICAAVLVAAAVLNYILLRLCYGKERIRPSDS